MSEQFTTEGLTIAPGVIETILAQAILKIDGVSKVGSPKATDGLLGSGKRRNPAQGVLLIAENDLINVVVHICVEYGYQLMAVAEQVRTMVADTLEGQIGISVNQVDVFVDSIAFPE